MKLLIYSYVLLLVVFHHLLMLENTYNYIKDNYIVDIIIGNKKTYAALQASTSVGCVRIAALEN